MRPPARLRIGEGEAAVDDAQRRLVELLEKRRGGDEGTGDHDSRTATGMRPRGSAAASHGRAITCHASSTAGTGMARLLLILTLLYEISEPSMFVIGAPAMPMCQRRGRGSLMSS